MNLVDAVVTEVISEEVKEIGGKEYKVYEVRYNCYGRESITTITQPIIKKGYEFLV